MTKQESKREAAKKTNKAISRPEDPDTQRLRRKARLLRVNQLPEAAAAAMQAEEHGTDDSETQAALRRATERED
jgi:hypothetical protein